MAIDVNNILENAELEPSGDNIKKRVGSDGEAHFIYSAKQWLETFAMATAEPSGDEPMPDEDDPDNITSVLPRNGTMAIELNNRRSLVRFAKDKVVLQPGKYAFKLTRRDNDLRWEGGKEGGNDTILRRGVLTRFSGSGAVRYPQIWKAAPLFGRQEIILMYVKALSKTSVGLAAEIWNRWGNLLGDEMLEAIEMIKLPDDYQAPFVEVGEADTTPDPTPQPEPDDTFARWSPVVVIAGVLLLVLLAVAYGLGRNSTFAVQAFTPELWLEQVLTLLNTITFLPFASTLVLLATAIFKRYVPTQIATPLIALSFQTLIWVLWAIANRLGYDAQFTSLVETLTALLKILMPLALGIGASTVATHYAYEAFKRGRVPLLGWQRPQPARRLTIPAARASEYVDFKER